jgi:hypothetical protein
LDSRNGPVLTSKQFPVTKGWAIVKIDLPTKTGVHDLYFSYNNPALKDPNVNGIQFDWFYFTQPIPGKGKEGYDSTAKRYWDLVIKNVPTTPVMVENTPDLSRKSFVFDRGNWLVKQKEVQPEVPHSLNPLPKGAPKDRLGLAMWLTDKQNPLTARTMVNRLWEQIFGVGLVETLEDMGTQGAEPTHLELLDHLSYKFMNEFNWSVKRLLKEILLSATYKQDSKVTKELLEKDPSNKYYARGARVRLSAEQVRDQALFIAGILSEKMYGQSVMPWQPEGIWMSPWNTDYWKTQQMVNTIKNTLYNSGRDGLCGNDDCGQMSAWYVFSSLGFYPVTPGTGYCVIGTPSFKSARLHLPDGKLFTIKAKDISADNYYIQNVKLNGKGYTKSFLPIEDIVQGGTLDFNMGNKPNTEWGSKPEDRPASGISD